MSSSNNNSTPTTPQKRDFERVDYDIEKTLYPDPPNEEYNEINASHQIEKSVMMHRVPTESLEEIPSLKKGEENATSLESAPSRNLEEGFSTDDDDHDEEKKNRSKFSLFYSRHRVWFQ